MTAIKSTGAPRGSVLLAFGVHLKTTVQAPVDYMGTVGIYPHSILADTFTLFQSGGVGGGRLTHRIDLSPLDLRMFHRACNMT